MKRIFLNLYDWIRNISDRKYFWMIFIPGTYFASKQFFSNRSLWLDEAVLALNIVNRSPLGLLQPLDQGQVAPILFLETEKIFSLVFADSDWGLRLFPLFCFYFSVYLMERMARLLTKRPNQSIYIALLYSLIPSVLYYSSEAKQYIADCLSISLMYFVLLKNYSHRKHKILFLSVSGILVLFLSNISPIILFTIGIVLVLGYLRERDIRFYEIFVPFLIWSISFLILYYFFIHNHPSRNLMQEYWAENFAPANPLQSSFWSFLFRSPKLLFGSLLAFEVFWAPVFALFGLGIYSFYREKNWDALVLICLPWILHYTLSIFHLYPFYSKFLLYTSGPLLIGLGKGIWEFAALFGKKHRTKILVPILFFLAFSLMVSDWLIFPQKPEHIKKTFSYMKERFHASDSVYVFSQAEYVYRFYLETGRIQFGTPIYLSKLELSDPKKIDNSAGRTWVIFSHFGEGDRQEVRNNFLKRGFSLLESFESNGSATDLFEIR